jgi:hypothetical protein
MASGHLFVVDSDLKKIKCDAWLLPTDRSFSITSIWNESVGLATKGRLTGLSWPKESRVLYFGEVDGTDIWLGRIGNEDGDEKVFAQAAADFIREATQRLFAVRSSAPLHWVPRLAINHIGTGRGGAAYKKWKAIKEVTAQVRSELSVLERPVDVIQVARGEKAEAAAQNIRMKEAFGDVENDPFWRFYLDNEEKHSIANELSREMRNSNVAVFMGAGVSAGAGLSDWNSLLEGLRQKTNIDKQLFDEVADNRDKAQILRDHLGDKEFNTGLSESLSSSKFSLQHALIASLPVGEFITTNVDTLFELSCESQNQPMAVLPILEQPQLANRWLLKIHGSTENLDSLVFTRKNYIDFFKSNRALLGVLQASLLTRHMLFVGYGLKDDDFHELLHEVENAFPNGKPDRPLGTVLTLFTDPLRDQLLRKTVRVVPMRERPTADRQTPEGEQVWKEQEALAIRDLERFLDLIGMLSSDHSAFLLDDQYYDEWSASEKVLVGSLQKLSSDIRLATTEGVDQTGHAWTLVKMLLRELGADL